MRLVQHKKEAYWFYFFLSNFYDRLVNPLFWTVRMREESLDLADLNDPNLKVIDVGSGTGFTTQGIVARVPAGNVTCVDQSHQQMAKAKQKPDLQDCTFTIGDAENIPYPSNTFDRYISAGSIEYWPDPQAGINESYRVIKPGGTALMIGPIEPVNPIARFFANTWMLFPPEADYFDWYRKAGFINIRHRYIEPHWFVPGRGQYGIAIAGDKPTDGRSAPTASLQEVEKLTTSPRLSFGHRILMFFRVLIGSLAGFIFIPIALIGYLFSIGRQKEVRPEWRETLTKEQIMVLSIMALLVLFLIYRLIF